MELQEIKVKCIYIYSTNSGESRTHGGDNIRVRGRQRGRGRLGTSGERIEVMRNGRERGRGRNRGYGPESGFGNWNWLDFSNMSHFRPATHVYVISYYFSSYMIYLLCLTKLL